MKKRVTGIGGIFFRSKDPKALRSWYRDHLGIDAGDYGKTFEWRESDDAAKLGHTVWNPFPEKTDYFDPSAKELMVNYRVEDLHALLDVLRKEGVEVVGEMQEEEYGKFGWVMDPEGNKVELWEPPETIPSE